MSYSETLEFIVSENYQGNRLDATLAALMPEYSRVLITKWIKDGKISINENPELKPKTKVAIGDKINVIVEHEEQRQHDIGQDIKLDIAYEDEYLLVVNKPPSLVVHPGAGNKDHTLVNALIFHYPDAVKLPRAGIVHRLDKDTTGLLIVAKDIKTLTQLTRMMQEREIKRRYLALVTGEIISGGIIQTTFGRHKQNRLKMAVTKGGKEAVTEYRIKKKYPGFTLIELSLITGRTHQIRVHMEYIKHPILGDKLYGGRLRLPKGISDELREAVQGFKRQALHAYSLQFKHPITGDNIELVTEVPEDFSNLLKKLDEGSK